MVSLKTAKDFTTLDEAFASLINYVEEELEVNATEELAAKAGFYAGACAVIGLVTDIMNNNLSDQERKAKLAELFASATDGLEKLEEGV